MERRATRRSLNQVLHLLVFGLAAILSSYASAAAPNLPQESPEGLKLVPNTKVSAFYLRDGADFSGYDKVKILDCYVAFKKDWKRDQNSVGMFRVSDSDMLRIKTQLADEFKKIFTRELAATGHMPVNADGHGVLVLRPAIVNLDVAAPDTGHGPSRRFSANAGEATLFLELYDSVTGELLARAYDAQVAGESTRIDYRNGMTNRSDADRLLTQWAKTLVAFLDAARNNAKHTAAPGK